MLSRLECYVDTSDLAIDYVDLVNPRVRQNSQVWPADLAVNDIVEVPGKLSDDKACL